MNNVNDAGPRRVTQRCTVVAFLTQAAIQTLFAHGASQNIA